MTSFVAIYRGQTVGDARLIAVSANPDLVAEVSSKLLKDAPAQGEDEVLEALDGGRRSALTLVAQKAKKRE
jgi:hypothetical protein